MHVYMCMYFGWINSTYFMDGFNQDSMYAYIWYTNDGILKDCITQYVRIYCILYIRIVWGICMYVLYKWVCIIACYVHSKSTVQIYVYVYVYHICIRIRIRIPYIIYVYVYVYVYRIYMYNVHSKSHWIRGKTKLECVLRETIGLYMPAIAADGLMNYMN